MLFCIPRFFHELVCGVVLTRCCDNVAALNAMPMLVFLNKLMIFLIFGLWSVNVVQILWFLSFGCVLFAIAKLITETERAIRLLDIKMQNTYRFMATKKLKQIINSTKQTNVFQKRQLHVLKGLNKKLITDLM
jgi:hypothetical protein